MHPEAYDAVRRLLTRVDINPQERWMALDIGGAYWNGSARPHLPNASWTVLDLEPPQFDLGEQHSWDQYVVGDATAWRPEDAGFTRFDVILCTEVFEHLQNWRAVLDTIWRSITRDGIAIITCASTGRPPHGATGATLPVPGEWYENVSPDILQMELYRRFNHADVEYALNPGDAYALAYGPKIMVGP